MDSQRKSRKKKLRNREISIKSGSFTKAKEKNLNKQRKIIKKQLSFYSSFEESTAKPVPEKPEIDKDFEEIVETLHENGRSSTPLSLVKESNHSLEDPSVQLAINEIFPENSLDASLSRSNSSNVQEATKKETQFMETVWMTEVRKDIATLFGAFHGIVEDVRDIKKLMMNKNRSASPLSIASNVDEDQVFCLLPQFQLKKRKQILEMEDNVNTNKEYKTQLIKKCATFGGSNIKTTVINIFEGIFTKKLKTKICWKGTSKKAEFKKLTGIRDVLRQAVNVSHKCTRHDIDKECKLRFNQAKKDYDREKEKKKREHEEELQ